MNGLEATDQIWKILGTETPVVVLTGAISNEILRDIALHNCAMLSKPVKFSELDEVIQRHLISNGRRPSVPITSSAPRRSVIHLVDDDQMILDSVSAVLKTAGHDVRCFATAEAFLDAFKPGENACLLVDAGLPGMSGLELMRKLKSGGQSMPCIMITGNSDVKMAVDAMKAGAVDFIEKPFTQPELLTIVSHALESAHDLGRTLGRQIDAQRHLAALTPRQQEIMQMVLAGHPSKNIASDLGISQRTVENHRASIMKRTGAKSLPALARLAVVATEPTDKELE